MTKNKKGSFLIVYEEADVTYKICRVLVSKDTSYFVTSSYHGLESALLFKATYNYNAGTQVLDLENAVDLGSFDGTAGKVKLSHHRDGFVQFSGDGLVSGVNRDTGEIKGVGVQSFPPSNPVKGPAFGMVFTGVEGFCPVADQDSPVIVFRRSEMAATMGLLEYYLEGHLFVWMWRRFVRKNADGLNVIDISHPAGAVVRFRVIFPPEDWRIPYFFGFEMYTLPTTVNQRAFSLSGPAGNIRKDAEGNIFGDGIHCTFPRLGDLQGRNLNFGRLPSVND